ncbi:MAG: hypothetical protein A2Y41_00080 [Spirochaetes bacterium GWB1_36_13]|nr:MAG: hypothetical protein A2Y41_00080 [Spirochaetes bacterium GWB1_36_13]
MKQKLFFFFFLFAFQGVSHLFAFPWESKEIEILENNSLDRKISYLLKDKNAHQFTVTYFGNPGDTKINQLLELKDLFFHLKNLKTESASFILTETDIQILLQIDEAEYKDTNLKEYLPSGIQLYYQNEALFYDFPIIFEEVLLRIKGKWETEDELLEKIYKIIAFKKLQSEKKDGNENKTSETSQTETACRQIVPEVIPEPFWIERQKGFSFKHTLRFLIGSGNLVSISYPSFNYGLFEFFPAVGLIYDETEILNAAQTGYEKTKLTALPVGLRAQFYPLSTKYFELYLFTGGFYAYGLTNYKSALMGYAGVGQVILKYFFIETNWIFNKEANGLAFGMGVKIDLD